MKFKVKKPDKPIDRNKVQIEKETESEESDEITEKTSDEANARNEPRPFPFGLCCYLIAAEDCSQDDIRALLRTLGVDRVWVSLGHGELRGRTVQILALQVLRDEGRAGGWPMVAPRIAEDLSRGGREVFELLVAPEGREAFIDLFRDGERRFGERHERIPTEAGLPWAGLTGLEAAELPSILAMGGVLCGEGCEALVSPRLFKVPPWTDKGADLFRFSERHRHGLDDVAGEGRVCFLAIDLETLGRDLRERTVHKALAVLEPFAKGDRRRRLGPLQGDLMPTIERLRLLPGDQPLVEAPGLVDIVELLALARTGLCTPGNRIAYLDEVALPLLNLTDDEELPELSAEELSELSLPQAMADQIPYFAPEGELLDSFSDEELRPLTAELGMDPAEEGAIWVLDPERILGRLRALNLESMSQRIDDFMHRWWEAARDQWGSDQKTWVEQRLATDQSELTAFFTTINELQTLLETAKDNRLVPALLFYE